MTNENIEDIIDSLNRKDTNDLVFASDLSQAVDISKVWTSLPEGNIGNESSYLFYLVKNIEGIYVAAVLDMENDLHVFVKSDHRKKGYLSRAMNEVILPHLFQEGRKSQRITFENPIIGEYVTRNWGFTITGEGVAEKDLSCYENEVKILPKLRKIDREEFKLIKRKIDRARLYLIMASEHVESICGKGKDAELGKLAHDILWLDDGVLNFIEKQQGPLA